MRKPRHCIVCTLLTRRQRKIWCGVTSFSLSVTKTCLPSQHLSLCFWGNRFSGILVATCWIIERCAELTQTVPWLSISGLLGGLLLLPQGIAKFLLLRIVLFSRRALSLSNNVCGSNPLRFLPTMQMLSILIYLPVSWPLAPSRPFFAPELPSVSTFFLPFLFARGTSAGRPLSLCPDVIWSCEMGENVLRRGPASGGQRWFCTSICQAGGKCSETAWTASNVTCSWSASCNPRPKKVIQSIFNFQSDMHFPNALDNQMVSS